MEDLKQFDYLQAFETLEYIFEGAMIPFVLLGETAERMKNMDNLEGIKELEIGVLESKMNDYVRRTFNDRWGADWMNKTHLIGKVPVNIKLIKRNYGFFKNPDTITYYAGTFLTGNPFNKYMKARYLVK